MPPITTDDLATFDECPRKYLYSFWETPRLSLATVLNEALRVALLSGEPMDAHNHLLARAANPGLAITTTDIYASAVHHAKLIELIAAYLLASEGPWQPAPVVNVGNHQYQPLSFLRPACMRRVVLCSRWDDARKLEEINSWRTAGDMAATNLPMIINAISIGSAVKGFRPTVWTRGWEHKTSKSIRFRRRMAESDGTPKQFDAAWRPVKREVSPRSNEEWLGFMQADEAFEDVVHTVTVDRVHSTVREELALALNEVAVATPRMRRSQCFKLTPCPLMRLCYASPPTSPAEVGWAQAQKF